MYCVVCVVLSCLEHLPLLLPLSGFGAFSLSCLVLLFAPICGLHCLALLPMPVPKLLVFEFLLVLELALVQLLPLLALLLEPLLSVHLLTPKLVLCTLHPCCFCTYTVATRTCIYACACANCLSTCAPA